MKIKDIQKLSKRNVKQKLKFLLTNIQKACKEDNLTKFEYSLSELYKISFMSSSVANLANKSSDKIAQFVLDNLETYKPKQISEKFKDEFMKLNQSLSEMKESLGKLKATKVQAESNEE